MRELFRIMLYFTMAQIAERTRPTIENILFSHFGPIHSLSGTSLYPFPPYRSAFMDFRVLSAVVITQKRLTEVSLFIFLEAPSGLEPLNDRFAIYSLSRLGTAPCALKNIAEHNFFVHSLFHKNINNF